MSTAKDQEIATLKGEVRALSEAMLAQREESKHKTVYHWVSCNPVTKPQKLAFTIAVAIATGLGLIPLFGIGRLYGLWFPCAVLVLALLGVLANLHEKGERTECSPSPTPPPTNPRDHMSRRRPRY